MKNFAIAAVAVVISAVAGTALADTTSGLTREQVRAQTR